MVGGLELIKWRLDIAWKRFWNSDKCPKCHFGLNCRSLTFIPAVPSKKKIARWGTTGLAKVYHWSQEMWGIDAAGQGNSPRIHARPLPINVTGRSRRFFLERSRATTDLPTPLDWDLLAGISQMFQKVATSTENEWSARGASCWLLRRVSQGGSRGAHVRLQKFIRLQWRQSTTKRRQKLTPATITPRLSAPRFLGKTRKRILTTFYADVH